MQQDILFGHPHTQRESKKKQSPVHFTVMSTLCWPTAPIHRVYGNEREFHPSQTGAAHGAVLPSPGCTRFVQTVVCPLETPSNAPRIGPCGERTLWATASSASRWRRRRVYMEIIRYTKVI